MMSGAGRLRKHRKSTTCAHTVEEGSWRQGGCDGGRVWLRECLCVVGGGWLLPVRSIFSPDVADLNKMS